MNHDSYPDTYIRGILNTVKTIAMVGASEKENRPSYFAFKYLLERGYKMIPVNPGHAGEQMLGQRIYARLSDISEAVDMVDIFRASQYALPVVQEALALNPRPQVVWMQLGIRNDEAAALAEANGKKGADRRRPAHDAQSYHRPGRHHRSRRPGPAQGDRPVGSVPSTGCRKSAITPRYGHYGLFLINAK